MNEIDNSKETNRRIAKNTFLLYCRMLISTVISLYTSRIILETLGAEDFGIYGVVGSITAIFIYVNSSMSGATSRFLTFELGKQNIDKLKKTFSVALTIHILIAILIFILGETIGLWFFENKLVVPAGRMDTARWVYQLSIIGAIITVTQVPYNASIIAHEQMQVYAYIEIGKSFLNLGIVFLLKIRNFDRLILYAILFLCVSAIISLVYRIYCVHHYLECNYKFCWDTKIIKPMLAFSSWNLYISFGSSVRTQGVNILLNMFFGAVLNAAYGIAMQVQHAMLAFAYNFLNAIRPQIIKQYVGKKIDKMLHLLYNGSKFSFLLVLLLAIPLIIENHFILSIWLKEAPDYSVVFCQLVLVNCLLYSMSAIVEIAIHATGKIKKYSIFTGSVYLLVLPISGFLMKMNVTPIIPLIVNVILLFIGFMICLHLLKSNIQIFSIHQFFNQVIFVCIYAIIVTSVLPIFFHFLLKEGWIRFIVVALSSTTSLFCFTYWYVLDKEMQRKGRIFVAKKIRTVLNKKNKL
jgi:O-antigen/teichoic acid export membrane protein